MAMSSEEMYVVEPKNNPQAVFDYFYNSDESGKSRSVRDVQMQAKQHLAAMGWSFHYIIKKPGKRELRYCPPDSKKKYISLRMACKGFLDSQSQLGASVLGPKNVERTEDHDVLESVDNAVELESGKANVDASTSKKRRLSSGDVYGERMLACMKGRVEDDPLLEDTLSEEENFAEFYKELCRESEPDSEKVSGGTESQETSSNDLFVPERKDTKVSKRGRKRKAGGRGKSGGKLALFLKSGMIKPLAKVYYRKKDGSVMGEGRVTSEGVDCSCCEGVFNLSHFESHVKSTYHRPAAHIFLEDGRSLMQIEQEMGALDNKVKGIKTKGNESKNGSVSETMHQKPHDDFCLVCREPGDLILCDQCTSAFHPKCLGLSEVPASEFWYCPTCCCTICGHKGPGDDSEPTNTCDQCEQQFHVKCIGQYGVADSERKKWFCSEKCKGISAGLGELLGQTFVVGDNNLSWTILKNVENVINVKTTRKLNQALTVMHECFQSVKEPWNGRDVAEDVIFSRSSEVKRLDYRGFYTVILEKRAEVVTVATVRIFGDKVAEVPLIATRFQYRRLGMCKTLMDVLEQKLSNLGVEKVVLPAISSVVDTWTSPAFGFTVMTTYERSKLRNYTLLSFPDNVTCQKLLGGSGQSFPGNCSQDQDSLFEVGICSLVDKNQMPSKNAKDVLRN